MERTEFHCHTNVSHDCEISVEDRVTIFGNLGFKIVYFTDHDAVHKKSELKRLANGKSIVLKGGIEVSTYFGHIILLDCYSKPLFNSLFYLVLISKIRGYRLLIPHPWKKYTGLFYQFNVTGFSYIYLYAFVHFCDYIEVYNYKENKVDLMELPPFVKQKIAELRKVCSSDSHALLDICGYYCSHKGLEENSHLVEFFESRIIAVSKRRSPFRFRSLLGIVKSNLYYLFLR